MPAPVPEPPTMLPPATVTLMLPLPLGPVLWAKMACELAPSAKTLPVWLTTTSPPVPLPPAELPICIASVLPLFGPARPPPPPTLCARMPQAYWPLVTIVPLEFITTPPPLPTTPPRPVSPDPNDDVR